MQISSLIFYIKREKIFKDNFKNKFGEILIKKKQK
jgi:hypothetical protein